MGGKAGRLSSGRALARGAWLAAVLGLGAPHLACDRTEPDDDSATSPGDDDTATPDDDTAMPFDFLRYDFEAWVDGAFAEVLLTVAALDGDREVLCTYPIEFDAGYQAGTDQGGIFWASIDESLTLLDARDPGSNDCAPEFGAPYSEGPTDLIDGWSPLGFYSCDIAATDHGFLGDDPTTVGDGTFASYCNVTAPAVAAARTDLELGDIEAIWLAKGAEGQMDGIGDYAYLPAEDGSKIWYVFGLLYAAADNPSEPVTGLDGHYVAVPLWVFFWY